MAGRFRFSMPPRRHHDDPWFRIGALDVTTTVLVALLSVVMIFVWAAQTAPHSAVLKLAMLPDEVRGGQAWRVVTWPFASNLDAKTLSTIIRIAIFWWFGRDIEAQIGRIKFTVLLLATVVVTGLVAVGLDVPLAGMKYLELAIFVLYVVEHPGAQFFFGIPGWIIAVVIVGAEVLDLTGTGFGQLIVVLAVALGTALLVGRYYGLGADQKWIPHLKRQSRSGGRGRPARPARGKKAKGGNTVVSGPWAGPSPTATADQAEVDRLLDKISAVGMEGLSADEKRRLKEASERLRRERG